MPWFHTTHKVSVWLRYGSDSAPSKSINFKLLFFFNLFFLSFSLSFQLPIMSELHYGEYGSGYTVEMKLARAHSLETLHQFMSLTFPGSKLEEEHLTRVKYSVPVNDFTLSQVFGALEEERERLGLEDYSVSQSTLEQVFLSLANGQPEEIAC
jgi:hypothetical protein